MKRSIASMAYQALREAAAGDLMKLRHMLRSGVDPNSRRADGATLLHDAAYVGDRRLARLLLDQGANPNARDEHGATPLHYAAARGNLQMVRQLVAARASINASTSDGQTALHFATRLGRDPRMVRGLIRMGVDPDARDIAGDCALHMAAAVGNASFVRVLLAGKADPAIKNADGMTPMDMARQHARHAATVLLQRAAVRDGKSRGER